MTTRVERRRSRPPRIAATAALDLLSYRQAVSDLLVELCARTGSADTAKVEAILADRMNEPAYASVLGATPRGLDGTVERLIEEVRRYQPAARSCVSDLTARIRIFLLAQIDAVWWGGAAPYETAADVRLADELVDLELLRRAGRLPFRYRRQPRNLARRAVRAVERRVAPDRTPRTAGLRFTQTRPEMVALLGQICAEFTKLAPIGAAPLWVTSMTRSVAHQRHLRELGYAAMEPSSHCVGWAVDVEMAWYSRYGARGVLEGILLDRQAAGHVNIIDEGEAWHVCLSPVALPQLRADFAGRYRYLQPRV
ncbi:MAG TPA: DUF5715 family protein [Asanoa sp.]